jgi:hypothetical protein
MFVDESRCGEAFAAAQLVEARVGSDAIGPGRERGTIIKLRQPLHDGHQCFLGGISGVSIIARNTATDGVDTIVVITKQLIESGALAT